MIIFIGIIYLYLFDGTWYEKHISPQFFGQVFDFSRITQSFDALGVRVVAQFVRFLDRCRQNPVKWIKWTKQGILINFVQNGFLSYISGSSTKIISGNWFVISFIYISTPEPPILNVKVLNFLPIWRMIPNIKTYAKKHTSTQCISRRLVF